MSEHPAEIGGVVCPRCQACLPASADQCSQCGNATRVPPLHLDDSRFIERPWVLIVLFLHVGFLGIPVYWKTRYSLRARLGMIVGSVVYTVLAVLVIAWGCLQVWKIIQVLIN